LAALALSANRGLTAPQLRSIIVDGANRVISGSDSRGGVNAAVTVALAAAGQTTTAQSAASTTPPSSTSSANALAAAFAALGADGTSDCDEDEQHFTEWRLD
jgi:hypothetical protein